MRDKKVLGLALCGSYCSYDKLFDAARSLAAEYELIPIMSETAASTGSRFGSAEDNARKLSELCKRPIVASIVDAEPLGPSTPMDALLIAPCTGNTLAKLAHGITDSAVTMAAKAHLRNGRPLILAISTNDGLSASAENIARLINRKNIYFVPFGQDDYVKKPNSLQADFTCMAGTVKAALARQQLQPILIAK